MKYLIFVNTPPGHTLEDQAISALRAQAQEAMPGLEVLRASVDDPLDEAFIDAQTLTEEIADRKIDSQDFILYCEKAGIAAYDDDQSIVPASAHKFLISLWGQGVFVAALPFDGGIKGVGRALSRPS